MTKSRRESQLSYREESVSKNRSDVISNFENLKDKVLNSESHKFDSSVDPIVHLKNYFKQSDFVPPKKTIKPTKRIVFKDKNDDLVNMVNNVINEYGQLPPDSLDQEITINKIDEFLNGVDSKSDLDYLSDENDEKEVNIFGQSLADKVSRMPGIAANNEYNTNPEFGDQRAMEKAKFQYSYLSSIQSIRTIAKDKLNKALQDRMNRLAIMDNNFKVMMNKRFLSQPKNQSNVSRPKLIQEETVM